MSNPSWEYKMIGFMDAFVQVPPPRTIDDVLDRATTIWWGMVNEEGAEGWEVVNFGIDDNGNYVLMKRQTGSLS